MASAAQNLIDYLEQITAQGGGNPPIHFALDLVCELGGNPSAICSMHGRDYFATSIYLIALLARRVQSEG